MAVRLFQDGNSRSFRAILSLVTLFYASEIAAQVHFSGLYVPQGLTCEDGERIAKQYGSLRAGFVIYDNEGRKSDDGSCRYLNVQALKGTASQIIDFGCSYDGVEYDYRQILTPLGNGQVLIVNSNDQATSTYQIYSRCGDLPQIEKQ